MSTGQRLGGKTHYQLTGTAEQIVNKSLEIINVSGDRVIHSLAQQGESDKIHLICKSLIQLNKTNHTAGSVKDCINVKNHDGKTPLHVACIEGHHDVVKVLIQDGSAAIDPLKRADWTPLMCAAQRGHLQIVNFLLCQQANYKLRNKDGWTAFHLACRHGNIELVNCFLERDPDVVNTQSNNKRTPLHTACLHGHLEVVKLLIIYINLSEGVDSIKDSCGVTPLMDAVKGNHPAIVEYLIKQHNSDISQTDQLGSSIVSLAVQSNASKSLDFLLARFGPNHSTAMKPDNSGQTPLHYAASSGHLDACQAIISYLANQGVQN